MAAEGNARALRIEPAIAGVSIVLLGDFNPAILTPAWFVLNELLPKPLAASARLEIAHAQHTEFETDWLRLQVTPSRFIASTNQAPYTRLGDLVGKLFLEILPHTPLRSLGINRHVHFRVESLKNRDRIGRTLAPTDVWGDWSRDLGEDGRRGGLTSLTMTQVSINGRPSTDRVNVRVEPSLAIPDRETGVFVQVNDHYVRDKADATTSDLTSILRQEFDNSLLGSDRIIDHVMSLAS